MKAYKGFNKDMTCRGFRYEEGKEYQVNEAKLCKSGFHACIDPIDCMSYYGPSSSVYHEVELEDVCDKKSEDSKICGRGVEIGKRLTLSEIISIHTELISESTDVYRSTLDYMAHSTTQGNGLHSVTQGYRSHSATQGSWSHSTTQGNRAHSTTLGDGSHSATLDNRSHSATKGDISYSATQGDGSCSATQGYGAHSTTQGFWSHSTTQGNRSHSTTQGNRSHSTTQGNWSYSVTLGDGSHSAASGKNSIAAALGDDSLAKAALGNWIVLAEYDDDDNLICVKSAAVDGEKIKADTWYKLENGEFVEVNDEEE